MIKRLGRFHAGWTLPEMMIALGLGTLVLAAMVAVSITVSRAMMSIGNYNDLDRKSSRTLDMFSRDVRNSAAIVTNTSTYLLMTNSYEGSLTSYGWDGSNVVNRTFTINGNTSRIAMLTNCDIFSFQYYQRNPNGNFIFVTSSVPAQIKLVSVSWKCSRTVLGTKLNTESVQTAIVVLRN
jgi:type II secretory pathway component PulJ